jgi:hypothetical protein
LTELPIRVNDQQLFGPSTAFQWNCSFLLRIADDFVTAAVCDHLGVSGMRAD